MPCRLLLYMVEIWRDILKNTAIPEAEHKDFKLPAIVPIILYNGESKWTANRSFKETLAAADLFGEYLIDFKYILIDVNRYEKKALMDLSNLIGTVFLLDQAISPQEYRRRFVETASVLRKLDSRAFRLFMMWFKSIAITELPEQEKETVIRILDETDPEEVEQMVSNMEQTFRKMYEEGKYEGLIVGEAKGKAEGRTESLETVTRNMLARNLPEDFIAEVTGLSVEQIKKIKAEMKSLN